jgi:cell volume regulation protein A
MEPHEVIETVAILLGVGLVSKLVADLVRIPQMLVLLGAGALIGPAALDAIDISLDSLGAQLILTVGVSFILFHGGLQLSARILERVAVGLTLLVIPGVIITALVTGAAAAAFFGVPLTTGLLIGAALAPTDPAILVPLFDRIRLRPKIAQTVIAESALNDPTGAVLALAFAGVVASGSASFTEPMVDFVVDLGISTALGCVYGIVLSAAVSSRRAGIWRESAAIAVMAVITGSFFSIDSAGGSGYLGAFLAGLIVGNMEFLRLGMHSEHERDMRILVANIADVMVMFVFLTLGANLPWRSIGDHLLPTVGVLLVLLFVARPLAVLACLLPDRRGRWTKQELIFLAWTRETGVVAAAIAGIIVAMGIEHSDLVVTTVAVAVVVTLAVQATTKGWLARRLELLEDAEYVGPSPPAPHPKPSASEASA